jgi:hypothetical protein
MIPAVPSPEKRPVLAPASCSGVTETGSPFGRCLRSVSWTISLRSVAAMTTNLLDMKPDCEPTHMPSKVSPGSSSPWTTGPSSSPMSAMRRTLTGAAGID